MLAKGIQLTVMIGSVVPVPVPQMVMDALDNVEITMAAGQSSGFQMSFQFSSKSELNTFFIIAGAMSSGPATPPLRVILIVTLSGTLQPLFDGVMTNVEVHAGSNGSPGTVTITGEDLTRVMDMVDFGGLPYPATSVEARVALVCAKYAVFGLVPLIIPILFHNIPNPLAEIPAHKGTDLYYIYSLARENGYVFYIEPGREPGTNIAYFGPLIKVGVPQPALNVDMDALTNVENLSFSFDPTKGTLPIVYIQNPLTRYAIPVPIPKLNPLQPPLGLLPTRVSNLKKLGDTAKMTLKQALSRGINEAAQSQDSVTASGSLNVLHYGRCLKARQLVGVRGAGIAYDGLYFVESVTSTLKRGEFMQSFNLTRNGLVSVTPRVPV